MGWAPTLVGYSAQGMFKFGLYEIFKDVYKNIVGKNILFQSILTIAKKNFKLNIFRVFLNGK